MTEEPTLGQLLAKMDELAGNHGIHAYRIRGRAGEDAN
jgi:hypothetical protein